MPSLLSPDLEKTFAKDIAMLAETELPVVTVSASFKEDLKAFYGLPEQQFLPDVVFSRAHYSMAAGLLVEAWGKTNNPKKAWVVDPTNYVSNQNWRTILLTELVGKTLARHSLLKLVKDVIDRFGRKKLPILSSITPPLLHLFQRVNKPILSFHIAAGNILAEQGKTVVQVITDPHVRSEYLKNVDLPNFSLCVFDDKTKTDALEHATLMGKTIEPNKIVVTGPPIDPRIVACREKKQPWRSGQLNLCLTTGGLGTNKSEIRTILRHLLPELRKKESPYRLMVYAGTQKDIYKMVVDLAAEGGVALTHLTDRAQPLSLLEKSTQQPAPKLFIIYHPQIVDANELLIRFGFPWADGFITKPSGDMAYDAAASGSFLLTLTEWGAWEHNVRAVFEQLGIARSAEPGQIVEQLSVLTNTHHKTASWVEKAMRQAQQLPPLFLNGNQEIIKAVKSKSNS